MKIKILLFFLPIVFSLIPIFSQDVNQFVIGSDGDYAENNKFSITYTIGEVVTEFGRDSSINIDLTQGFNQSYISIVSVEDHIVDMEINVFPNPVRPNFNGLITIQGIRYNSDVKITDVAGNLVYKTTSNGGTASWNVRTLDGQKVATGVYLIWTAANSGAGRKVGKVLVIN